MRTPSHIVAPASTGTAASCVAITARPRPQADATTKKRFGGTGLGLLISRDLARAMGGDLEFSSPGLGKGCLCVISLPAARSPAATLAEGFALPAALVPSPDDAELLPWGKAVNGSGRNLRRPLNDTSHNDIATALHHRPAPDGAAAALHVEEPLTPRSRYGRQSGRSSAARADGSGEQSRLRVLAAEDDALLRRVLKMTLSMVGMDASVHSDGLQLLEALARAPAGFDLILMVRGMRCELSFCYCTKSSERDTNCHA